MSFRGDAYDRTLARAAEHARTWLDSVMQSVVQSTRRATDISVAAHSSGG